MKPDCVLIEGKLVNNRAFLGSFMQNRLRGCLRLLGTTAVSRQEGRLRLSNRNAPYA